MNKKVFLILMCIFLYTAGAYCQMPEGQGFGGGRNKNSKEKSISDLNISDSKKLQINIIQADLKRKLEEINRNLKSSQLKKKGILKNRNFNSDDVKRVILEISEIRKMIDLFKFESLEKIRKILTNEEWQAYLTISDSQNRRPPQGEMGGMQGRRHSGPPPGRMNY